MAVETKTHRAQWFLWIKRQPDLFKDPHVLIGRGPYENQPFFETAEFVLAQDLMERVRNLPSLEVRVDELLCLAMEEEISCITAGWWGRLGRPGIDSPRKHFIYDYFIPLHGWMTVGLDYYLPVPSNVQVMIGAEEAVGGPLPDFDLDDIGDFKQDQHHPSGDDIFGLHS